MKTRLSVMAITLSVATLQVTAHSQSGDEQQVREVHRQLSEAVSHNDVGTMEKLVAPDVLFIGNDGRRWTKAERIEDFRKGNRQYATERVENLTVRMFDNVAVFAYDSRVAGVRNGAPFDTPAALTRVYMKRDGEWRLIHQQSARVQTP